jgi:hypothetical protein
MNLLVSYRKIINNDYQIFCRFLEEVTKYDQECRHFTLSFRSQLKNQEFPWHLMLENITKCLLFYLKSDIIHEDLYSLQSASRKSFVKLSSK